MTSRELFLAILRREATPRHGLHENFWTDTLALWLDHGYPTNNAPDAKLLVDTLPNAKKIPVSPIDHFGIDDWKITNWLDQYPIKNHKKILSETPDELIYQNGAGATLRDFKNQTGVPEHIGFTIFTREIWERNYLPHLAPDADRINFPKVRAQYAHARASNKCVFYCHEFIWETMRRCLGDVNMYTALIEDPAWIHSFNRAYTDFYITQFKRLFTEVGRPDGGWIFEDIAYGSGLFCSPDTLSELFFPYYRELADFFHSYNLPIVFHSDGKLEKAIPLIIDAGYDALNPLEYKSGCLALDVAERFGQKIALIGGLPVSLIETNDRQKIDSEIIHLCRGMKNLRAHYAFGTDHSISPNVKLTTYARALETFHAYATL